MSMTADELAKVRTLANESKGTAPELAKATVQVLDHAEELQTALEGAHRVIRMTRDNNSSFGELESASDQNK